MTTRILEHATLIDLKHAVERSLRAVPNLVLTMHDPSTDDALGDLAKVIGGLVVVQSELQLDLVDDEPDDPIAPLERITRNGGRADG